MQRDVLKSIKEFMYQFEQMKRFKITQKNLSDGYIMMQFLSILEYKYFNPGQITRGRSVQKQQSQNSNKNGSIVLLQRSILQQDKVYSTNNNNNNRNHRLQLPLLTKLRNWKTIIKKLKQYFGQQHEKGIKYSDIDIVDLSKNHSIQQICKMFQLTLCVVANCTYKQQCIQKIMQLQPSTQQILAQLMSTALQNRLCTLQNQQRLDLLQQLTYKQQELNSLYEEIQHLEEQNQQLREQLAEYEKTATQIQYEKQKILLFNKRNHSQIIQTFNSLLERGCEETSIIGVINHNNNNNNTNNEYESILQESQYIQSLSQQHIPYTTTTKAGSISLIESLKNRLIHSQQTHQQQVYQLQQKIYQLQQQLKQSQYLEQLLLVYQQKYQQALSYVQKVSLYEKQKNKINQQMIQKDVIIEELTSTINELNQRLVEIEEEKIDLELLVARKNSQKMVKLYNHHSRNCSIVENNRQQLLDLTTQLVENAPMLVKKSQTLPQQLQQKKLLYLTHNYQKSQQIFNLNLYNTNNTNNNNKTNNNNNNNKTNNNNNNLSLSSMYPYMQDLQQQQPQNLSQQQLQIKLQTQNLQIRRLLRKQKQLTKSILLLKNKLTKMKIVQSENSKLSNIILQLHLRRNLQMQIVVSCLYQTYRQFDFKFNKLIGGRGFNSFNNSSLKKEDYKRYGQNRQIRQTNNIDSKQQQQNEEQLNKSIDYKLKLNKSQQSNYILQDSSENQIPKNIN